MAVTVFPTPTTDSTTAYSVTITAANTLHKFTNTTQITAGVYRITCVSSTIATVYFWNDTELITSASTSSGTVDVNLASVPTRVDITTNTGSNIIVNIAKIANAITTSASGTLDTITASGTYTQTGRVYVVAVGGGGGGGGQNNTIGNYDSGGGGAGAVVSTTLNLTSSTSVTIGTAGLGATTVADGGNGGTTTFGSVTAAGGGGGNSYGTPGTNGGTTQTSAYPFVKNGSTGAGGTGSGVNGSGSGIGTGGRSGDFSNKNGSNATGYGAGGGGSYRTNSTTIGTGGNGTAGVVYVLRGI